MAFRFADIILPLALPKAYTYAIPLEWQGHLSIGHRVVVQFGKQKLYTGIIYRLHNEKPVDFSPKPIEEPADDNPLVTERELRFWTWLADYYVSTLGDVMNAALPGALKLTSESTFIWIGPSEEEWNGLSTDEEQLAWILQREGEMNLPQIQAALQKKNVYPLVQKLMYKRYCAVHESLKEQYKPKMVRFVSLAKPYRPEDELRKLFETLEKQTKQLRVLMTVLHKRPDHAPLLKSDLVEAMEGKTSSIKTLVKNGVLIEEELPVDRLNEELPDSMDHTALSPEQEDAIKALTTGFASHDVMVLEGVTGSGKTHVYMELIERLLEESDKQILYLVPEIALTTQLVQRLQKRFGQVVGVYHSKFNEMERVEIWEKVQEGHYRVVLTARSGLFLPFTELGLVVIDEEQERSYKQHDPTPRYHARDAAIVLAAMHKAKVLMGSATLSMETRANIKQEKFGHVELKERYGQVQMPSIHLLDTTKLKRKKEMQGPFSKALLQAMEEELKRGKQVLVFHNRRGFSSFLHCDTCGWIPQCKHCDVSLTYHKFADRMMCHYCGYHQRLPQACTACGTSPMQVEGMGTEQISEELAIHFPDYHVARMDLDTTRSKQGHAKIIAAFQTGKTHILVGTQMISKGLDFANVSLAVVVDADQLIHFPDFRSAERAFNLLMQLSGRAGRREEQGRVIIQSRKIEQPLLQWVAQYNMEAFAENEWAFRRSFGYPPFKRLIQLTIKHGKNKTVQQAAYALANELRPHLGERVLGPAIPPISRIRNRYIREVLLKIERDGQRLKEIKRLLKKSISKVHTMKGLSNVVISINVDP